MNLRRLILHIFRPLNTLLGRLSLKRKLGDKEFKKICKNIENGDVLVTRKRFELSNLFIPGYYTHAALYLVRGDHHQIIEVTTKGIDTTSLANFLFSKDYVALLRPKFIRNKHEQQKIIDYAVSYKGRPYDFYFEKGEDSFYCSELIWRVLRKACPTFRSFKAKKYLGIETIVPQDFRDAKMYFELILEL